MPYHIAAEELKRLELYARAVTVGVYLMVQERYLFVFGPNPSGDKLAIVRVGGHREPGEDPHQCALRETLEETGLTAELEHPPGTWQVSPDSTWAPLSWASDDLPPWLVLERDTGEANLMYMARASGQPQPCAEVRGLLLLTSEEVVRLCRQSVTLDQFLADGGIALMRTPYPGGMLLEPARQMRLLATLLTEPALAPGIQPL